MLANRHCGNTFPRPCITPAHRSLTSDVPECNAAQPCTQCHRLLQMGSPCGPTVPFGEPIQVLGGHVIKELQFCFKTSVFQALAFAIGLAGAGTATAADA